MSEHPFDEAAWRASLLSARAATLAVFADPRLSPYAAVARHELREGERLLFGSAEGCAVLLEGLPARAFQVRVSGEWFECEAIDPGFRFRPVRHAAEGEAVTALRVQAGARVIAGRYGLRFSHQNAPAVLVLDPRSEALREAAPPRWFEPEPALRVEARLLREAAPPEETVLSTRGQERRALRLGRLVFTLQGAEHGLTALRLLEPGADEAGFSIFFRDLTTGAESYPVGRYLDPQPLEGPQGARWLLDFNTAYNPACAFSPLFNCPIPPRENRLPIAIRAGERDPHPGGAGHP